MRKKFLITSIIVLIVFILSHTSAFASKLIYELDCGEYKIEYYDDHKNIYRFNKNVRPNEGYLAYSDFRIIDSKTLEKGRESSDYTTSYGLWNASGEYAINECRAFHKGAYEIIMEDGSTIWLSQRRWSYNY